MPKNDENAMPGSKSVSVHDDYEIPDEIDFSKTTVVGFGLESLDAYAKAKPRVAQLAPDVAKAFPSDEEVNEALRLVQQMRLLGEKSKRSA